MARSSTARTVQSSKIPVPVLAVLSGARGEGRVAYLPEGQLDRKLYLHVNDVLEGLGGAWSRKLKGHLFPEGTDVAALLDAAVVTGEYVSPKDVAAAFNFFRSPPAVVEAIVERLDIRPGHRVLEPSAGDGAICDGVRAACPRAVLDAVEIQDDLRAKLEAKRYPLVGRDFLDLRPTPERPYDRIAMNPPFRGQADIEHVVHALSLLNPGGRLVAIMSAGTRFRHNKKAEAFRGLLQALDAEVEDLPEGSFLESGTGVQTILVTINKPEGAAVGALL